MKKLISIAVASALMIAPALAGSQTIEFTRDDGNVQTWTFNTDGTASGPEGVTGTYTWDAEAKTLCAEIAADEPQKTCVTFEETQDPAAVGFTTKYSTDSGAKGVAKIVAVEKDEMAGEGAE